MARTLTFSSDFPYPVEAVFAQAVREECLLAKSAYLGRREVTLEDLRNAPGVAGGVLVHYQLDAELPGWASRMMTGSRSGVTETNTWGPPEADGRRGYAFVVDIASVPIEITGTLALVPTGEHSCRDDVSVTVASNMIPLIAGKLEELIAGQLSGLVEREVEFMHGWMKDHAPAQDLT